MTTRLRRWMVPHVDEMGEELLASPGLAEQQHCRVAVEDLARQLDRDAEPGLRADRLFNEADSSRPAAASRRGAL